MTSSDFWAAFAAVIAFLSAVLSVYVAYRQLRIQSLEKYLSAALYVAWDCYKAAQIFVATWTYDQEAAAAALLGKKLTDDQKKARSNFETSWRKFDADITSSLAVIEAAEGESGLVLKLRQLHASSSALYDRLVNERMGLKSESWANQVPSES